MSNPSDPIASVSATTTKQKPAEARLLIPVDMIDGQTRNIHFDFTGILH